MYTVFLIDDEIWALRGLQNIIPWEEYGFYIKKTFTDSEEALREALENAPDVIFTDVRMPEVDGLELIQAVQNAGLNTQIVIVSAYRDFEVAKRAMAKGVLDYLLKPLEKDEVKRVVCHVKEKLDKKNDGKTFNICDYDLSVEKNFNREDVQKYLLRIWPEEKKYLVLSEEELPQENISLGCHAIYAKGYKYAYIINEKAKSVCRSRNNIGISRGYKNSREFLQKIEEAEHSLKGNFYFSENEKIAEIQWFLCEHYNEKISLKQLSEKFYLSEAYLFELFKKNTGTTILNFIKELRMYKAVELLQSSEMSVKQIAEETGYMDAGYFNKLFRQKYECTPDQFRKNL